ncbi:MAG: TonB-dependent receptor plug domain-containing protein, partial [Acidobacteria bacterium]|nr:TonB-dependent receptor plug domain-containing protein [Acidobacteriota bacterium]
MSGIVQQSKPVRSPLGSLLLLGVVLCVQTPALAQDRRPEARPPGNQAEAEGADPQTAPERRGGHPDEDAAARPPTPQFDEEVVVVGSRAQPRSVVDSTVPIDAIPATDLRQGDSNLANQLRVLVPSFHVNPQEDGDMAAVVRPASLRGLAPDHTLVLVNGKRRHRGAVIAWQGSGVADGAQGSDISTIPAIALRGLEVLRDGAAAQYGSDAIAGVLNLLLKDDRAGGRVELRSGTHAAGDGREYGVAANAGLPLGRAGFANLSLEYGDTGSTDRSVQRADAAGLIAAGNGHVRDPAQRWGAPDVGDDLKLFANLGHVFAGGVQAYGHANYARRDVLTFFY